MTNAIGLLLHCRAGFEKEALAEAVHLCALQGLSGFARLQADSAFVRFELHAPHPAAELLTALPFADFVFARERHAWIATLDALPERDRASHIAAALAGMEVCAGKVIGEFADTNAGKEMSGFLRAFTPHLEKALRKAGVLVKSNTTTLHLFFDTSAACEVGLSFDGDAAAWPMGVPRLRMPRAAPSRSTLKLAEAFLALMTEDERNASLRAGLSAVDLGAAPGGWTLQFAERGLHVTAVDNGPLAESVLATGMVEHQRADGFTFRPRKPVEWLVCDMVEQPARIAQLIADWVASGRCRRSIFNLKLPMKKRYDEIERCRTLIAERLHDRRYVLRMKHLYHDREEITCYLGPR